ncbi:iron ABC transporter permease [Campylobacter sp. MIT 12-5580]|uniref:FecCD family ABC transporter permease n=1 Tax=Campylobacter sp. MIT 12-5580 TaxID=2040651 RepID=UPI0010F9F676|nr:iron ABC transporter permease [Campylobacter sp. MIT 12-5580]TKX28737.1 iron ABC transporter permease [Campylobacter sp. MIT 12-5580]
MKAVFKFILALVAILLLAFFILGFGRFDLSYAQIAALLSAKIISLFSSQSISEILGQDISTQAFILLEIRLPRVILAIVVGAGLGIAGASFQAIFRNALASPDILGVASGAGFGAVLALLFGLNIYLLTFSSFAFGLLSLLFTIAIARGAHNKIMIILSGIIISALFQSFISLLKYLADPQDVLPAITYWLLGSLAVSDIHQMLFCCFGIILGCVLLYLYRWKHNVLLLEDMEARTLGLNVSLLRLTLIFASTLIIACIVSMCGVIGWIGLIIPHIARLIWGFNAARVLPYSLFVGAIFMLVIDTLSRSLSAAEIPISILSALVGAPFFIFILYKTKGFRI